jgi:hypothetical protein
MIKTGHFITALQKTLLVSSLFFDPEDSLSPISQSLDSEQPSTNNIKAKPAVDKKQVKTGKKRGKGANSESDSELPLQEQGKASH